LGGGGGLIGKKRWLELTHSPSEGGIFIKARVGVVKGVKKWKQLPDRSLASSAGEKE